MDDLANRINYVVFNVLNMVKIKGSGPLTKKAKLSLDVK